MPPKLDPAYEQALATVKQAGIASADPLKSGLAQAREAQQRYFAFLGGEVPAVSSTRDHTLSADAGAFAVRLYYPSTERPLPVLVFVRGAGWWAGNLDSHDRTMRLLALKSGLAVCGVDFHCAPEARFPTQLHELTTTVQWLKQEAAALGIDAGRMVLMGESAGATLCALAGAELGQDAVSGLVLFYGNLAGPSEKSREYSRWVWSNFLDTAALPANPAAVPLHVNLSTFPPAWLGVGDCDPLIDDTTEFADALKAQGRPHGVKIYPGVPHAFLMMSRLYDGADAALGDAAEAARAFIGQKKLVR